MILETTGDITLTGLRRDRRHGVHLGAVVILDNLGSREGRRVRELIEATGAKLVFLLPYSPDLNPIEMAFAKIKALLRKAAERTVAGVGDHIGDILDLITPHEAQSYFAAAGYDPN